MPAAPSRAARVQESEIADPTPPLDDLFFVTERPPVRRWLIVVQIVVVALLLAEPWLGLRHPYTHIANNADTALFYDAQGTVHTFTQ